MELKFNRRVYTSAALKETIAEYAGVADARPIKTDGEYFVVGFDRIDDDVVEVLGHEFSNYALYRTIVGRQA